MKGIGNLMKQAQQMQKQMEEVQKKLADLEVEGSAGGSLIKVTATGKGIIKKIFIDPSLLVPDEKEMLEDLLIAAINDAKMKAEAKGAEEMGSITGGMKLPGGLDFSV